MPSSPFPDPNRTLDDYESDVAAFGTWTANWWRVRYRIDLELALWRLWLVARLCSKLATSTIATNEMAAAMALSLQAIDKSGGPRGLHGYLDECRRREGERS